MFNCHHHVLHYFTFVNFITFTFRSIIEVLNYYNSSNQSNLIWLRILNGLPKEGKDITSCYESTVYVDSFRWIHGSAFGRLLWSRVFFRKLMKHFANLKFVQQFTRYATWIYISFNILKFHFTPTMMPHAWVQITLILITVGYRIIQILYYLRATRP